MTTVEIEIWVDQHVYDHYGYDPAHTFQSLLADNLSFNNVDSWAVGSNIEIPLDGRDDQFSGDDATREIRLAFEQWVDENVGLNAQDSAHLLFDVADKGTWNGAAQNNCSVAVGNFLHKVDSSDPPRWAEADRAQGMDVGDSYRITMSEVGHDLGICGNGGCDGGAGDSAHGCGFNYDSGSYYAPSGFPGDGDDLSMTPMGEPNDSDTPNDCGYYGVDPADKDDKQYNDGYWFSDCAGDCIRNIWNS